MVSPITQFSEEDKKKVLLHKIKKEQEKKVKQSKERKDNE